MSEGESSEKLEQVIRQWESEYEKTYKGKVLKATTDSGIPVKPVYTQKDLLEQGYQPEMPGVYPYTRGNFPLQYQFTPWVNNLVLGYGLPENTRERMDLLQKMGARGYFGRDAYNLVFDLVGKAGYDPDNPETRGRVGIAGCHLCTKDDFDRLFHDMDLTKVTVVHNICRATLAEISLYIAWLEEKGIDKTKVMGNSMNWLWTFAFVGNVSFPPKSAFKLMVEFIKYCSRNMPQWNHTNVSSYYVEESGGTAVEEAAFAMSAVRTVAAECMRAGLKPDEFLGRIGWQIALGEDFFEEICKIRAMRKMWAKIAREELGATKPRSMALRAHSQTSGVSFTAQQPLNNVVRATLQTLAGVLGGVNSIQTNSYLEALSTPTEESHVLALRTQQIIYEETNIPNVSDALGGSYFVEWLTSRIEKEATELIRQIDEAGGFIKCWESGWFKQRITSSASRWRDRIVSGEKTKVGLNKYVMEEKGKVPTFAYPQIEDEALRRLAEYKARRDSARVKRALEKMNDVAIRVEKTWPDHSGELMPATIEAARTGATLGELQGVLINVFGWA